MDLRKILCESELGQTCITISFFIIIIIIIIFIVELLNRINNK